MTTLATDVGLEPDALTFLLHLLDQPAPSSFEGLSAEAIAEYAATFADVRRDSHGSLLATVNAGARHRIALFGHSDEIGLVLTKIETSGLLRFQPIGGWDEAVLVGQRVRVRMDDGSQRTGTVGRLAAHQLDASSKLRMKDLWIDIGVASADEAREIVSVGAPIVLDTTPVTYTNGRIMSRALDNRLGCFIALEVARACAGLDAEVTAVAAVSEETRSFGAHGAAFALQADAACVIDVMPTSDVPGRHDETIEVSKGPAVCFGAASRGVVGRQLIEVADRADIDIQLCAVGRSTGTDAESVVKAGAGTLTGVIYVPTRYLHSPGEVADLRDVSTSIKLLHAWVSQWPSVATT